MKNLYNILILFTLNFLNAQEGVTISFEQNIGFIQRGTYIKDINNAFGPYLGTWEGIWDNKKVTLVLQKMLKVMSGTEPNHKYYDRLVGKYTLTDLNTNTVLLNTMNTVNYSDFYIKGIYAPALTDKNFILAGYTNEPCNIRYEFVLSRMPNNPNHLSFGFGVWREFEPSSTCPYNIDNFDQIQLPFPKTGFLRLNKI
jgi:hypothetical protein